MPALPNPLGLVGRVVDDVLLVSRALAQLERLERRADAILALGARIDARAEAMLALGERIDARAAAILGVGEGVLELGERIDAKAGAFIELSARIEAEARNVHQEARLVTEQARQLTAVLPTMTQAVEMIVPLEGAVERLGRVVDRLPGGRASAARRKKPSGGEIEGVA